MTKTQANEPGFVQLPEGWLAIEMKAAEAEIAKWPVGLRASFESLFRASTPLLPSPAYGGVKALEWEEDAAGNHHAETAFDLDYIMLWTEQGTGIRYYGYDGERYPTLDEAIAAAQADFERRILACIEAAPVTADEGGAALGSRHSISHDGFTGTVIGYYERLDGKRGVVLQQDGTKVVHVYGEKWLTPAEIDRGTAEAGEAVAWAFEALLHDGSWGLFIEEKKPHAPPGGAIRNVRPLYALPPSLAHLQADNERLTRERDETRAAIFGGDNYPPSLGHRSFLEMIRAIEAGRLGAITRAETAEARVTALQERLEKVEAALTAADQMASSCINFLERLNPFEMAADDEQQYHAALNGCRVHYPAARRAALTGDAQEGGR